MSGEQSRGVRYLLGKLPPEEAEALGEELFGPDETHSALEDAESELIEGYLDGSLSADDRQRFESLFRSSSLLNERVELARALEARAGRRRPAPQSVPWLPWAAALVVGLAGGGVALQANRQAAREREALAVRERTLTARVAEQEERLLQMEQRLAGPEAPPIATWHLATRTQRSGAGARTFGEASVWVRLRIPLERTPPASAYQARLSLPEGGELYSVDGVAAVSEPGGTFVDVMVPGALLPRGTYILSLVAVGPGARQELGPYPFSVRPHARATTPADRLEPPAR